MGKGTIQNELGAGLYEIVIDYDTQRAENYIAELTEQAAVLASKITEQAAIVIDAQSAVDAINSELNAAIIAGQEIEELAEITKKLYAPSRTLAVEKRKLSSLRLQKLSAEKKATFIQNNLPAADVVQAWAADYSEGLTGEVGLIEINGETIAPPIIYPNTATEDQAAYNAGRDFQIQPIVSSGPAAVYFNKAMLPGWQKWRPFYRLATIDAITNDTCDVTLQTAQSSQQSLDINQTTTLSNVSIEYMNVNGGVFEVGDSVVLEFTGQDWAAPKVIGFENNPRPDYQLFILNDVFGLGSGNAFIKEYGYNDNYKETLHTKATDSYSRSLERIGDDFYWYELDNGSRHIRYNGTSICTGIEDRFAVNGVTLWTHKRNEATYDRTIQIRNRFNGNISGTFQATVPGQALASEDRPYYIGANDDYFYHVMPVNEPGAGLLYVVRSNHDGSNPTTIISNLTGYFPASTAVSSWRGVHFTNERIYVPWGSPTNSIPIECYVFDAVTGAYIDKFGPLPYVSGTDYDNGAGGGANIMEAFAANDHFCVWLEDLFFSGGDYIHVWKRNVTRAANGDIVSESWDKRPNTGVNLAGEFDDVRGGLSL